MKIKAVSQSAMRRVVVTATMIMLMVPLLVLGCQNKPAIDTTQNRETPTPTPSLAQTKFDGARALEHVRKQVAVGPHWAGSPAIKEVRDYITKELESYGLKTR